MERLIRTAWRAFWVGLGASSVLIGQSLVAPVAANPSPEPSEAVQAYELPWATPAREVVKRPVHPLVGHDPFDTMQGRVRVRVHDES